MIQTRLSYCGHPGCLKLQWGLPRAIRSQSEHGSRVVLSRQLLLLSPCPRHPLSTQRCSFLNLNERLREEGLTYTVFSCHVRVSSMTRQGVKTGLDYLFKELWAFHQSLAMHRIPTWPFLLHSYNSRTDKFYTWDEET